MLLRRVLVPRKLLMGVLYDVSIPAMIAVSVAAQLAAIPLYISSARLRQKAE